MITPLKWRTVVDKTSLSREFVDVWVISFEKHRSGYPRFFSVISKDEKERANRFHFEKDRIQYVTSRGILRMLLAQYLDLDPSTIEFSYGKNGKPQLGSESDLRFNVSHSGDIAVYGLTLEKSIGIDVEEMRVFPDMDAVAQRFFYDEELFRLGRLPDAEKNKEFFRIWTRGEALLKWSGDGMIEPMQRRELCRRFRGKFYELAVADGYAAVLATEADVKEIRVTRLEPLHISPTARPAILSFPEGTEGLLVPEIQGTPDVPKIRRV